MSEVGLLAAVAAGVLSLLSPCSALLLPSFFAYAFTSRTTLLLRTAAFYLGLVMTLVPLGIGAGAASTLFYGHRQVLIAVAGWSIVAMGALLLLGRGFALPFSARLQALASRKTSPRAGLLSTVLLGAVYGLAGFCSGPVLGAILTMAATQDTPVRGACCWPPTHWAWRLPCSAPRRAVGPVQRPGPPPRPARTHGPHRAADRPLDITCLRHPAGGHRRSCSCASTGRPASQESWASGTPRTWSSRCSRRLPTSWPASRHEP